RLLKANGTYANQVMLVEDDRFGLFSTASPVLAHALTQMDRWLTALASDGRQGSPIARIVRNRPGDLTDACWTRDAEPRKVAEPQVAGDGKTTCEGLYPVWPSPRMVAGGAMANDVIKCRLRPFDPDEYGVQLSAGQVERLRATFPEGVCDWSAPGIGQQGLAGTWQSFGG
ncbi:MAG: DUF6351 family protein, partial [Nocardioidaceae bacterium]